MSSSLDSVEMLMTSLNFFTKRSSKVLSLYLNPYCSKKSGCCSLPMMASLRVKIYLTAAKSSFLVSSFLALWSNISLKW